MRILCVPLGLRPYLGPGPGPGPRTCFRPQRVAGIRYCVHDVDAADFADFADSAGIRCFFKLVLICFTYALSTPLLRMSYGSIKY